MVEVLPALCTVRDATVSVFQGLDSREGLEKSGAVGRGLGDLAVKIAKGTEWFSTAKTVQALGTGLENVVSVFAVFRDVTGLLTGEWFATRYSNKDGVFINPQGKAYDKGGGKLVDPRTLLDEDGAEVEKRNLLTYAEVRAHTEAGITAIEKHTIVTNYYWIKDAGDRVTNLVTSVALTTLHGFKFMMALTHTPFMKGNLVVLTKGATRTLTLVARIAIPTFCIMLFARSAYHMYVMGYNDTSAVKELVGTAFLAGSVALPMMAASLATAGLACGAIFVTLDLGSWAWAKINTAAMAA
jgi:hypothetical protein